MGTDRRRSSVAVGFDSVLSCATGCFRRGNCRASGKGPAVGHFQRVLLTRIQIGELLNTRQDQLEALKKRTEREKQKNHVYN